MIWKEQRNKRAKVVTDRPMPGDRAMACCVFTLCIGAQEQVAHHYFVSRNNRKISDSQFQGNILMDMCSANYNPAISAIQFYSAILDGTHILSKVLYKLRACDDVAVMIAMQPKEAHLIRCSFVKSTNVSYIRHIHRFRVWPFTLSVTDDPRALVAKQESIGLEYCRSYACCVDRGHTRKLRTRTGTDPDVHAMRSLGVLSPKSTRLNRRMSNNLDCTTDDIDLRHGRGKKNASKANVWAYVVPKYITQEARSSFADVLAEFGDIGEPLAKSKKPKKRRKHRTSTELSLSGCWTGIQVYHAKKAYAHKLSNAKVHTVSKPYWAVCKAEYCDPEAVSPEEVARCELIASAERAREESLESLKRTIKQQRAELDPDQSSQFIPGDDKCFSLVPWVGGQAGQQYCDVSGVRRNSVQPLNRDRYEDTSTHRNYPSKPHHLANPPATPPQPPPRRQQPNQTEKQLSSPPL